MLQKMGEHIHGWIAGIFVVVISVVFVLFGVSAYFTPNDPSSVVLAKVNGEKLIAQMLSNQLTNEIRTNPSLGALSPQARLAYKKQAINQWVNHQAILTTLAQAGMLMSPDVVRDFIISTFQVNGSFSNDYLAQYTANQGYENEQQLYEGLSKQMAAATFGQSVQSSVFISPNTISHYFVLLNQQRTFRYSLIQTNDFLSKVSATPSQLQAYYMAHVSNYLAPETVSVDYVQLSPAILQAQVQLDEAQLQSYYQNHLQDFTKAASWTFATFSISDVRSHNLQANDIAIQKIFDDQVKALRDANNISDFLKNYKPVTQTSDALSPAMMTLLKGLKPGQVSSIQKNDILKGDYVYYLVSSAPSTVQSFDQVKDKIADLLKKQQVNNLMSAKSDQMINLAYSNPESLDQIAKALALPIQTTAPFTRSGLKNGPASSPKLVSAAYGDIVLTQGINSDPVTLQDGSVVIIHLHKYMPAYTQSFATVESAVKSAYMQEQALQLAQVQANLFSDQLNKNKNVALTWKNIAMAKVGDTAAPAPIVQAVFDKPFAVGDEPVAWVVPMDDQQVAVVQLQALHVLPPSAMTALQSQSIQKQLMDMQQQAFSTMVQNSIIKHSKVAIYPNRVS
jgi:peptidyl-prolyl cis-trans isomerase D